MSMDRMQGHASSVWTLLLWGSKGFRLGRLLILSLITQASQGDITWQGSASGNARCNPQYPSLGDTAVRINSRIGP